MKLHVSADDWADALKTGGYKQGQDYMCSKEYDEDGNVTSNELQYCCLGVLSDLVRPHSRWNDIGWFDNGNDLATATLPNDVLEAAPFLKRRSFPEAEDFLPAEQFATLNDNGATFEEIADIILEWEKNDFDSVWLSKATDDKKLELKERRRKAINASMREREEEFQKSLG